MTEEEYFRKNYPDSCYGDRPLSPYWDFFQDGVEFGERQSEKRIKELEQQIEKMKCCSLCNNYNMNYLPYWCKKNCVPTQPYEKCKCWEIKENVL